MIKYPILTLLAATPMFAKELPSEFKDLKDIRESRIEIINEQYVDALKKLKMRYTKKGDLESAILVDEEIKLYFHDKGFSSAKIHEDKVNEDQFLGVWVFDFGDWERVRTLEKGGSVKQNNKAWGNWKIEGQDLIITFRDGGHINIFTLPFKHSKITGKYITKDTKGRVSIKRLTK
ncbi:MAG: hypothetical protein QNK61_01155 [Akkermansiaceae bacterium]